jgi:hypothetical protein
MHGDGSTIEFSAEVSNRTIDKDELLECRNCTIGPLANYPLCNPGLAAENRELIESEKLS